MEVIIFLLATFGLAFLIKQSEGPFGIVSKFRNCMMRIPLIGVQFYKLLECYFCLGIWAAGVIFLLQQYGGKIGQGVVWVLAGAMGCLLLEALLNWLNNVRQN